MTGVLKPASYAPEIDAAVLIGFPAAEKYLGFDGHPSQIFKILDIERTLVSPQ